MKNISTGTDDVSLLIMNNTNNTESTVKLTPQSRVRVLKKTYPNNGNLKKIRI